MRTGHCVSWRLPYQLRVWHVQASRPEAMAPIAASNCGRAAIKRASRFASDHMASMKTTVCQPTSVTFARISIMVIASSSSGVA
jgi:hypothetical protein